MSQSTSYTSQNKSEFFPQLALIATLLELWKQTTEAADKVALKIESARPPVLGFDVEWKVSLVKGEVSSRDPSATPANRRRA